MMAGTQTSTSYDVDNRYSQTAKALDNQAGKHFLNQYLNAKKEESRPNLTENRKEDNRFIMSAPGYGTNYTFTNAFSAENSPVQRRLSRMGQ